MIHVLMFLAFLVATPLPAETGEPATATSRPQTAAPNDPTTLLVETVTLLDAQLKDLREQLQALQSAAPEAAAAPSPRGGLGSDLRQADALAAEIQKSKELYRFLEVILVSCVAVLSLGIVLHFLLKARGQAGDAPARAVSPQDIMNASGLSLIIFGTLLVVMIADADQQLTASVGILGALAGYLFRGLHDDTPSARQPPDASKGDA